MASVAVFLRPRRRSLLRLSASGSSTSPPFQLSSLASSFYSSRRRFSFSRGASWAFYDPSASSIEASRNSPSRRAFSPPGSRKIYTVPKGETEELLPDDRSSWKRPDSFLKSGLKEGDRNPRLDSFLKSSLKEGYWNPHHDSLLSHLKQAGQSPNAGNAQTKSGSSSFGNLKSSLKEGDRNLPPPLKQGSFSQGAEQQFNKQQVPSSDAIRNTLSRLKSAHPDPLPIGQRVHPPSLTEIYKKNAVESDRAKLPDRSISFNKDHLWQRERPRGGLGSLLSLKDSLIRKPVESATGNRFGEASELPQDVFGKELNEMSKDVPENALVMDYSMEELGKKSQTLRPGVEEGESWFSLSELGKKSQLGNPGSV